MRVRSGSRPFTQGRRRGTSGEALRRIGGPLLALLALLLLWVASDIAVPAALADWTGRLQGFATVFLGIFIEALPFLLAGVLLSSAISIYVSDERIQKLSPRNPFAASVVGAFLGMLFPVCECGSIPTARRLISKGAPVPLGLSFALAAPVVNPIVVISTYVAFVSWEMVAWRLGLTLVIAILVGWLIGTAPNPDMVLAPGVAHPDNERFRDRLIDFDQQTPHLHEDDGRGGPVRRVLLHANGEFFEMVRYLILGAMIAAGLQTLVPQAGLLALGDGPIVSVLVLMALAVILSICSTVDAFIALSFVNTFSPGAIIAFLVFGPMIDIKSMLLLTTTFRRRVVALVVLLCFQLALLAGIFVNFNVP